MAAKPKVLPLLLNTSSPIGEANVFKNGNQFVVYYKQHGFLARAISTGSEAEVKSFLLGQRVISEANYDRIMDPDTPPVLIEETRPAAPPRDGESDDYIEEEIGDEFDEVSES